MNGLSSATETTSAEKLKDQSQGSITGFQLSHATDMSRDLALKSFSKLLSDKNVEQQSRMK